LLRLPFHRSIRAMKTKQFERDLRKEKAKLEQELHKVAMTLEALAVLTGKRVYNAAKPLRKRVFKQSAKARKAMSDAKKAWWAAKRKATKA
jgi:ElaB/YqjD/DUF883 family membrane-anchored ribosome-binding protein